MKKITLIALMLFTALGYAQVGINTNNPDASSALEIESTTGGILIPRLTQTQRDDISAPATGLMIYQTDQTAGFYFYDGNIWTKIDGVAGPAGDQGVAGSQGSTGPSGANGANGNDGAAGSAGAQGAQGEAGLQGIQGTQGDIGLTGSTGPSGPAGANGDQGVAGSQGIQGPQGPIGLTGAAGIDGTNGSDGVDGAQGPIGLPGPQGTDGTDGVDGAQGPIGLTGADGIDGTNGSDGVDGAQGPIGLTGAAGVDGQDGAPGPAGADGASYTQPTYLNNTFYAELGGYVIQISPNGKHGLVVAMQDQGFSNWYEASDILSNASNHDADGKEFSDWRLPNKRELNLMHGVFISGNAANFDSDYYWSSTEYNTSSAWFQYFDNGAQSDSLVKNYPGGVRAVRAF